VCHTVVDPNQFGSGEGHWEGIGAENLKRVGFVRGRNWRLVEKSSTEALPELSKKLKIDVALIDGYHLFDYTLIDVFYCLKMLRIGGVLIVDDKKMALQIGAFNYSQEDYGQYILYGLPQGDFTSDDLIKEIDEEVVKLQHDLISEKDFEKLQNINENNYVDENSGIEGVAENLATYYLLYGDVNLINTNIEMYRSITREEIRTVAQKYLNPNQRLILDYVPAKDKADSNVGEQAKQNN
jgi:hypothetical protein